MSWFEERSDSILIYLWVTGANRFCYCSSVVSLEGGERKKDETIVFSFLFYFPYIIIFDLFLFLLLVIRILREWKNIEA